MPIASEAEALGVYGERGTRTYTCCLILRGLEDGVGAHSARTAVERADISEFLPRIKHDFSALFTAYPTHHVSGNGHAYDARDVRPALNG